MNHLSKLAAATFAAALCTGPALAQQATPEPTMTMAPAPSPVGSMSPAPTTAPATATPETPATPARQIKTLAKGTLTRSQLAYGVLHPLAEVQKVRKMHGLKFENLRVYRVTSPLSTFGIHAGIGDLAYEPLTANDMVAQSTGLAPWLNILANINVQNALNNVLNGNTVSVSLSDILNANKIGIGQVVGLYVNGLGVVTTIIH